MGAHSGLAAPPPAPPGALIFPVPATCTGIVCFSRHAAEEAEQIFSGFFREPSFSKNLLSNF